MALPEHAPHIPHIPIPDVKGAARWALTHWKPVSLSLAALAGSGYLAFAQDRGPDTSPVTDNAPASDTIKPPEQAPNVAIITNPPAEPTAEAQKPPAPEVRVETPCGILSPKLCATAKRLEEPNPLGGTVTYIALSLQSGETISAPINGQMTKVELKQPAPYQGFQTSVTDASSGISFTITGDLEFNNMLTTNTVVGEVIARVGSRGITNRGNYNVLIDASRIDPSLGRAVDAVDILEKLFPEAFKRPAELVSNPAPGTQYFGGNIYLGGR